MTDEIDVGRLMAALAKRSPIARDLGVELVEGGPGFARLAVTVSERMVNGSGICHGGYIFTIADMAGAWACLSRNRQTVTQTAHISYVSPARQGERLIAEAVEMTRTKRSGTYDVRVAGEGGRLVALFRGQWRIMDAPVFPEDAVTP